MKLNGKSNYRLSTPKRARPAAGRLRTTTLKIAVDLGMALLAVAMLAGFFLLSKVVLQKVRGSETFLLHTVVIEGNGKFGNDEIMTMARLEKGSSIFDVDPEAVKELIERQAWIKEADVKKMWPDAVTITVRERSISATVLVGGVLYHIDRDGEIFERHPEGEKIETVLITGIGEELAVQSRELVEEELRKILQFVEIYQKFGLKKYAAIGEVHRENGGGLVVYTKTEAREIRFGSGKYLKKIRNLRVLLKHLSKHKRQWEYVLLDSEAFPSRMVAKLR